MQKKMVFFLWYSYQHELCLLQDGEKKEGQRSKVVDKTCLSSLSTWRSFATTGQESGLIGSVRAISITLWGGDEEGQLCPWGFHPGLFRVLPNWRDPSSLQATQVKIKLNPKTSQEHFYFIHWS